MSAGADRLAMWWTRLYTRGLDTPVAQRRCAEIRSDLYEHRVAVGASTRQSWDVVRRTVGGVPADLTWRIRQPRPDVVGTAQPMLIHAATALTVLVVLFDAWSGVVVLTASGGGAPYATALTVASVCGVIGLVCRSTAPALSTGLAVTSGAIPSATLYWMAPVFVPVLVVLIVLVVSSQHPRSPRPETIGR